MVDIRPMRDLLHIFWNPRAISTALANFRFSILFAILMINTGHAVSAETLRLAVASTLEEVGLVGYLVKKFETENPAIKVSLTVTGSINAIELGRTGKVDGVMSHHADSEAVFVADGYGESRTLIMYNNFAILGPPEDKFKISSKSDLISTLQILASNEVEFYVQGNSSGTYKKLMKLLDVAGIEPDWLGFESTGSSSKATVLTAAEFGGYAFADMGTYFSLRSQIKGRLIPLFRDHRALQNYNSYMVVSAKRVEGVNQKASERFLEFLVSDDVQNLISNFGKDEYPVLLYTPIAHLDRGLQVKRSQQELERRERYIILLTLVAVGVTILALYTIFLYRRSRKMEAIAYQKADELEYQSVHDALTGLPNRKYLENKLESLVANASSRFALFIVDLDQFKRFNDTLGPTVGDSLIKEIARRLSYLLSEAGTVARIGGDEFAIIVQVEDERVFTDVSGIISSLFSKPVECSNHVLYLQGSIGCALYPDHGSCADDLVKHANIAMYSAKNLGRLLVTYAPESDQDSVRYITLESDLRKALDEQGLELYYQPKVCLRSNKISGVEVLSRWKHPELGFIPPDEFIPIAERSGLIKQLTRWMISESFIQIEEWARKGLNLECAVNLSPWDLCDIEFVDYISGILQSGDQNLVPMEFEITENVMMDDPSRTLEVLNRLKKLGVSVAIDDFGTGFSSLSYITRFPVDTLKIDKSFVMDINNAGNMTIVRSTIELAHQMGLKAVAEGVEDQSTLDCLGELGCDCVQGYFISKPMDADAFWEWASDTDWV